MKDCSSAEDTDTDAEDIQCDEPLLETRAIEALKLENFYWDDSEDDDVKMTKTDDKDFPGAPLFLDSGCFPS